MDALKQSIADQATVRNNEDYHDASPDNQNAYNNAIHAAEGIINAANNPELNADTITAKAQQVIQAKSDLNGDENLATAKQNAQAYLNTLPRLTDQQKDAINTNITKARNIDAVNQIKQAAQSLNSAMNDLQNAVNNQPQVTSTVDYTDADTNKQQAYNDAITAAQAILNKTTGPNTAQNKVEEALQRITTTQNNLNGNAKLTAAKAAANQQLGTLAHITDAQRHSLENDITQATNLAGVEQVNQKAQSLDNAMSQLETLVNNSNTIQNEQNYLDADQSKQSDYDLNIVTAQSTVDKTNGPNTPVSEVNSLISQIQQAQQALNGQQNLEKAKQSATTTIDQSTDLNNAQKSALKTQVTNGKRVAEVNAINQLATELNNAMTNLKQSIVDKEQTLNSINYINADEDKRQTYTTQVNNAESIINGTQNGVLIPSQITNAATQVTTAKDDLNGDNNLRVAKEHANNTIDGLAQLNDAQKTALKTQVASANTLPEVQTIKSDAQTLNGAMQELRNSIANATTIQASQDYTDADPNLQQAYSSHVTNAQAIINKATDPVMDPNAITQTAADVTVAEIALNGNEKLTEAKEHANNDIDQLSHLNQAQIDDLQDQVEKAKNLASVNQVQTTATTLNTTMAELQNVINDHNTVEQGIDFTDADQSKKDAYTNAVTEAQAALNKTTGHNLSKQQVDQIISKVTIAKQDLNGEEKVADAKTNARQTLDTYNHLNNAQTTTALSQINNSNSLADVAQALNTATELNTAMGQLKDSINDKNQTLQSQNYIDADYSKQNAYSQAVTHAESIVKKNPGLDLNKTAVEQAITQVKTAKQDLDGARNLDNAKAQASTMINGLTHLTDLQKENLNQQIQQAKNIANVNTVKGNANTLNTAMGGLRDSVQDNATIKAGQNYVDASTSNQDSYNTAVYNANAVINETTTPNMDANAINQLASQVRTTKGALNGADNLVKAKAKANNDIGQLTHLNQAQINHLNDQVQQANNIASVNNIKATATELNTAMGELKDSTADANSIKQGVNYTDADVDKQQAYDNALSQANAITNKDKGSNANKSQVEAALQAVTEAKRQLNGDNKVAKAKAAAKQALNTYANLNDAQKAHANDQIDDATTLADVTQAQTTSSDLNTAMGQLKDSIQDQTSVKQQVNFTDADPDKKTNYTNAVTKAESILNPTQGENLAKDKVLEALNQVTSTKDALNGDTNVQNAKNDANTNLDTLDHLNNAQTNTLRNQINHAATVAEVNEVKNKAQALNQAMSQLQQAIANKDQTLASQNYLDADSDKKTAYTNAVTNAENVLEKATGTDQNQQAVEQMIQAVTSADHDLNGATNLQTAKNNANQAIDNLNDLNAPQKETLKEQVNQAQNVSGVTDIQNNADALNSAMTNLKQAIADHDDIVADGNYTNASADKQGAYTDAYTHAQNLINGSPNVVTNPADINTATQKVNKAENELNGNDNLNQAKQDATDALRQMTDLTDAQRQAITNQINGASQLPEVATIKTNAQALNTAMTELRREVAKVNEIKASQPYYDADQNKQADYTNAINAGNDIINASKNPTLTPQDVTQATNQIKTTASDLNGAQNLAIAKQNANQDLNQLSHLNQAQHNDLSQQINDASNIATVNQVTAKGTSLDQAMEQLINAVNEQTQVKQSVNYTDADQPKQQAYDNAINNGEGITNANTGSNANQAQVEAALSNINTAKQDLNGNQKVTDAKNDANQTLNGLTHLNNAQRDDIAQQINQASTLADIERINNNAQELNTAMGQLQDSLNDKTQTLDSQNYLDADPAKKTAYTNAIANAENALNPTQGGNLSKQQVEAAVNQVNTTKNDLNGAQNLANAKQQANNTIDGLTHLTTPQKDALKQLVQDASTVADVQTNEQKAQDVDTAMEALRQSIADNTTTTGQQNYIDASPNKKEAYNNAVNNAQNIIDNTTNPSLDPSVINQAATTVNQTKDDLNGADNLNQAKQQATQTINTFDNLNNAQQQSVDTQINNAGSIDDVNRIKNDAQNLNDAMANLKQAIADKDQVKQEVNFTDADPEKQAAYNQAVTNAENILAKATGSDASQSEVEQAIQQIQTAKQDLNGNDNVARAKNEATQAINNANNLNQGQKDALNHLVNNATTVAAVHNIKQTSDDLNNAMTQLIQGIANKDQVKGDGNYTNANPDKQQAYNDAVKNAQQLIDGTPNVVITPTDIQNALTQVNQAKDDLNGNTNLATAKQEATNAIDQLPNLNQAQRDEYHNQINQSNLVTNVNAIQQAAENLNNAMTQLKQGIANKDDIKASENYHDADPDKQQAYTNAVNEAEALLTQATNPTMDPNAVTNALTKVNDANNALNGNEKLATEKQNAKTTLGTLDHLNNAQVNELTTQIDNAPNIATVNKIKQTAENLNQAMTNLANALQDKTPTLNSVNFTDADQDKKDEYNAAITQAENMLSKDQGGNVPQAEVEQALQRVESAKRALNGNENLQNAKNDTTQLINQLSDLNQNQKDVLNQQVTTAPTVSDVNTIKQNAQALNQAMTSLKQGIADKDQTIADGNFTNADPNKQVAYQNAVNQAEQIINGTPNSTINPQAVNQALQQVEKAKGELNGNDNLHNAQQDATHFIDGLSNLNTPQKAALKEQIAQANLVPNVEKIKQTANDLNTAMGNLKQQLQTNQPVPQTIDYTQADTDKQQAYDNAVNQSQQIIDGNPTTVLTVNEVTQALSNLNNAKDDLNGNENLAQAKQEATTNLNTLTDLNQPQHDALAEQINQAQSIDDVNTIKQNAQNVNNAMHDLKQGVANREQVLGSENYHDADSDKQQAYTDALNNADAIINQTAQPSLNPDDIVQVLTQVNNAKNDLNGDAKLATEKQNAKSALDNMSHLNNAQKEALTTQIDQAANIAKVHEVKQIAENLEQAMNELTQAIHDKSQTLQSGNYLNADNANQDAYNQAVTKAENVLNQQTGPNELQNAVVAITDEVNNAKQNLNGDTNLAQAKQDANQSLAQLQHLNDAQRQNIEAQINQAPLVTEVQTIKQQAQALDHAMDMLRDSIKNHQQVLDSEDYHDATANRQNDYNNAVTAANNTINQTTSPTMNPIDVTTIANQVNTAKDALDGDENLINTKQQANQTLGQLDHLNQAQMQNAQTAIAQAPNIATVNNHVTEAQNLNTAMGNLINAIADHNDIKQQGNFVNADPDKQTAYTNAVTNAQSIINEQTGQNANQQEVEQAMNQVQQALQDLNGDHNLQVAKSNAEHDIDSLSDLNDPQKDALKQQINVATLVTAVHQIKQNADTLNQAMHGLRQSIQDNAAVKADSIYVNEDPTEQQNYDQAVQNANAIINEQQATLDPNIINTATNSVNQSKQALHGDVKLQNDKDRAKQTVSQLPHLNDAQKHMEDTLIDNETTRTAVNNDLTEAQALDQLMAELQDSIADKNNTLASSQFINAEPNKKQAYTDAIQNAENIINGLTNPTINKGNVSQATQAVTTAKQALDGVERLAEDKQNASNSINHFDQLTPAQQQAIDNAINQATTRDEVAQKLAEAQELNNAMKALKDSIQDQQQVKDSSNFINEDPAQKDAYKKAVQDALDLINETTNPILDKTLIDNATQAVNDSKNNLHGEQKLADDKQNANNTIDQLTHLNTPQRQALENGINQATTRDEVAQKLNEAQALDQSMKALKDSIQDQQQIENSSQFINEDPAQKDAYTNAVQHAKDLINETTNPTMDKTLIDQATQAVNNAKDQLHGEQKLANDKQHAIENLNQMNGLNTPQRQALENDINQATTRDEVAQKLTEAQALDHAMQNLKDSIQDQQQVKDSSNFINEDPVQKDAYTNAVQHAKDLINETTNPTMDKAQIEQATQEVNNAKADLHGEQKLIQDQQQANTTVDGLNNLNQAQQQALKDQVNAAPTRTDVAQIVQNATQLDQEMERLNQAVTQAETDKAQPNYTEASTDKQDALNQSIEAAKAITNIPNGSNATKQQVEQAINQIQQTSNDLDGNQRVNDAKTQAKQTIDQLQHLNDDQKATAKQNVEQVTQLQPIAQIVEQTNQLDQAMNALKQAINNQPNVKNTVDYTQADTDKQDAYNQAVTEAQQLITQNATQQQIDQALQAINNAKQDLNGDEKVAESQKQAKQTIDQLQHLNQAQHQSLIEQVEQSQDLNNINQIVDDAKALNQAMNDLQNAVVNSEGPTKTSGNYINADTSLQHDFDQAITNANKALDKPTGSNLSIDQVNQLKEAIDTTKAALNGDQRLNDTKVKALQDLNQLNHLNDAQKEFATQQINNADILKKVADAIKTASTLDQSMNALNQYIQSTEIPVKASTNYIDADHDLKSNYDQAIKQAHQVLNQKQGSALTSNEVNALKQAVIKAENALNGDQNVTSAKSKANQFIDQLDGLNQVQKEKAHLQVDKANDLETLNNIINNHIDLNDAMNELKSLLKNEVPSSENSINYQNADDNIKEEFDQAKRNGQDIIEGSNYGPADTNEVNGAVQAIKDAINHLNGDNRLQESKNEAIKAINKTLNDKLNEINKANATEQDKVEAKNQAEALVNQIINDINKSTSNQAVENVNNNGQQALNQIHANEIPKAQIDGITDIDQKVKDFNQMIDANPELTDKEKQQLKDQVRQLQQQANDTIAKAATKEEIEIAKQKFEQALNGLKDYVNAKVEAKQQIKDLADAKNKEIDSNPNLTPEQKEAAKAEVERMKQQALKDIENANNVDAVNKAKDQGQSTINNFDPNQFTIDKAKADAKKAIEDAANDKLREIDNNPNLTPEQKEAAKAEVERLKQQALKDIENATDVDAINKAKDKAQTAINNFDPNQFTIDKAKADAKKAIEDAANDKLREIDSNPNLTPEQKEAAKAEVERLKQQALKDIENATDVDAINKAKDKAQTAINNFDPNQFTIDKAKADAKKAIEDAFNQKVKDINDRKDLSDKEKQDAINKLNQLKDKALKAIDKAKDLVDINKQKDQFKSQIEQYNPIAKDKDLAKRKSQAISIIKQISSQKSDEIRNSRIGTLSQRQDALNRIAQIVNDTIININNATTSQAISDALNDGIARILAVQINDNHSNDSTNIANALRNALSSIDTTSISNNIVNTLNNSSLEDLKDSIGKAKPKTDDEEDNDNFKHHKNSNGFVDLIKNTLGFVGISSLLAGFWFILAKRRKKEEEEETVDYHTQEKEKNKHFIDDADHTPLLVAKKKKKKNNDEENNKKANQSSKNKQLLNDDDTHPTPLIAKKKRENEKTSTKSKVKTTTKNKKVVASKKKKKKSKKSSKRKK
ncbi:DUF1542 domain-containing protein [Staphylococcus warneri]|uniref:DUF1542 domain-containing protein n=2 Tax=Staphylococcus TaxID=1279 RepID=UPI0039F55918